MQQQQLKCPIRLKPIQNSSLTRLSKKLKPNAFPTLLQSEQRKLLSEREAQRNIGQNISLIAKKQEGSFISNRQDHSLDSFDKMIMGVDEEIGDIEDQNTSNSKEHDPNYTMLYREFERLVKKRNEDPMEPEREQEEQEEQEEESNSLKESKEESRLLKEEESRLLKEEAGSNSILRQDFSQGDQGSTIKVRLQQARQVRKQKVSQSSIDPNTSLRLLGGNLSEIHEQQIQHSSMNRMDPIQQQFIDFVGKNEPRVNISNIEKHNPKLQLQPSSAIKNQLNSSIKEPEEDEVVAMLENQLGSRRDIIEEESLEENEKQQGQQQFFQKENYPQILRELDENEDKKDNSNLNVSGVLTKREEWINSRNDRSTRWKKKELLLIAKIKEILFNPYVEFSDEEEFNLSL